MEKASFMAEGVQCTYDEKLNKIAADGTKEETKVDQICSTKWVFTQRLDC